MGQRQIIHLAPKFADDYYGSGTWKAVRAMQLILTGDGGNYEKLLFEEDSAGINFVRQSRAANVVVIEYSKWPALVRMVRRQNPAAKVFVRTINAEAFQHAQCRGGIRCSPRGLKTCYQSFRVLLRDVQCKLFADGLLGISEWDDEHYWRHLPGRAKNISVPYFCPWPELTPETMPIPWEQRQNVIVAMPGGRDPLRNAIVDTLNELAEIASSSGYSTWRFILTEGLNNVGTQANNLHPRIEVTPVSGSPWELLTKAKAVVMVTPFGFGNKTTITDGLTANCHVLLHPVLANRQPELIRKHCQVYPLGDAQGIKALLKEMQSPPPPNNLNELLRTKAATNLATALAL